MIRGYRYASYRYPELTLFLPAVYIIGVFEDGKARRAEEPQGEPVVCSRDGPL
jgi:hypothetical protein